MNTKILIGLIIALLALASFGAVIAVPQNSGGQRRIKVRKFNVLLVSANETSLTVTWRNYTKTIPMGGKWIVATEGEKKLLNWSDAYTYLTPGENATLYVAQITLNNRTWRGIVRIVQDNTILTRAINRTLLKRGLRRLVSRVVKIDFKATIVNVTDKFLVVSTPKGKLPIVVKGSWTLAGQGSVEWSEIKDHFKPGDTIWVYGRLVIFKKSVRGIKAVLIPKTIVNLETGETILRQ